MYTDRRDDEEPRLAHPLRNAGYVMLALIIIVLAVSAIILAREKIRDPNFSASIGREFFAYVKNRA